MAVWTEKRAYNRFVHREPIGYAYRSIEKSYRAEMVNYSEGGAYFKSAVALRPGQNIYVRIENLSEDAVLPEQYEGYHAEVSYCKKLGKADARFYGIGVQYLQKISNPILPEKHPTCDHEDPANG